MTDRFNFAAPIQLACADDPLRPIMECVHFMNGFAYASNAYLLIKQSLEYSQVQDIHLLEGKSIHRDSFKEILTYQTATATEDGIQCKDDNDREAFYYYAKVDKIPEFEKTLSSHSCKGVDFIGMNPKHMAIVSKALIGADKAIRINFNGIDKGMLIEVLDYENQVAFLMPVPLEPTLF